MPKRLVLLPSLAFLLLGAAAPRRLTAQLATSDSLFFVRTTQALLDGVTSGDTTTWARVLAPNWVETDEEGRYLSRADLLAALHPLPPGQSGKLTLDRWRFIVNGDVVVMTYDADEEHQYYGQTLITVFHSTDTWVKRRGRWWQVATQQTALPRPVAGIAVAPGKAAEFAGSYALTPEIRMQISTDSAGLLLGRAGGTPQRLYAMTPEIFIRHGVRGFWVFERDSTGRVVRLVDWRDNNRVAFERMP